MTEAKPQPQRWKCTVAYDGTRFAGWQSQASGDAIQDLLERCLAGIFEREVRIHGSGRTDSGVHARGQVFHFDADWPHGEAKLLAAFRTGLPPTIQVNAARPAASDFHSRFSATGKIYHYQIRHDGPADPFEFPFCWAMPHRLDVAAMRAAAAGLTGRHDFRSFSAVRGEPPDDTVRTLRRLDVTGRGGRLCIAAEGDGFLYKMVRSLVGALVSTGLGQLTPADVAAILRQKERTHRVKTAPPQGLCLMKVLYR
jgi:tRNA pseudouridine38-40 synthase